MQRQTAFSVLGLLATGWLVACGGDSTGPGSPGSTETFEWSGQVAGGGQIEIKGVNGGIQAFLASGTDVEVSVVKRGQVNSPSSVTIDVVQHTGGVTICAVYPDVTGQPANQCLPGAQGSMSVRDNDVEVTFTVRVPSGVEFRGQTVNGSVEASGLQSNAFAATVNGSVDVTTTRLGSAATVNGTVTASIGLANWDRDLAFTTINGNVSVKIPAGTNANARLSAANGSITTEFPLPEIAPRILQGTIGAGGPLLTLSTVNGNVALQRR